MRVICSHQARHHGSLSDLYIAVWNDGVESLARPQVAEASSEATVHHLADKKQLYYIRHNVF